MITLTDRCHIPASPERIWRWFADLASHYREWHPAHVDFQVIRGSPVEEGSICFFDTWIGDYRLRVRTRVAEAIPNRYLRHNSMFPGSLANAGGSFTIEPTASGCALIAEAWVGYEWPVLAPALDRILNRLLPLQAVRQHMAEEGRYLAQILDSEA